MPLTGTPGELTEVATAWMDRAWDAEVGLLWNPPGAFAEVTAPRSVHLVRETAWYAVGLLRRDAAGDQARAEQALEAVLAHQYDQLGRPWHGTFVRFPEWPAPSDGAIEWVDYDPNWRQFVGTALAVAVTDFNLDPALEGRARAAIDLAVTAEPPERVPPTYANIALLRAWLERWAGHPDLGYADSVVTAFRRHDCFVEYGSPTYYGIDLLALGLWQRADSPAPLQQAGADLEAALWTDVARWWHAGLGNLCGPYSRAYGMDLHGYVAGLSLALRCAGLEAPLPDLTAEVLPHGHDVCMAPLLEHLGVRVPDRERPHFVRFAGARAVEQVISDEPRRIATGWLDDNLAIGAEDGDSGLHARGQFHPATAHWRQPDGTVGWLRVEHHAPTRARAEERRLVVECDPHPTRGPQPVTWVSDAGTLDPGNAPWVLPGVQIDLHLRPPTRSGTTTFDLRFTPAR